MTEKNEKELATDQIYRSAVIVSEDESTYKYSISVQLETGQYDLDLTSLKNLKKNISPTYTKKEWRFVDVQYYKDDDANGEDTSREDFENNLQQLGLTIQDLATHYYHRALLAGIKK